MRHWPALWGSVLASTRAFASRTFSHHTWRKAEEIALLRRVSVAFPVDISRLGGGSVLGQRLLQRLECYAQAAVVGGIFTQRQPTVQVLARRNLKAGVLLRNALGPLVELLQIVGVNQLRTLPWRSN